MSDSSRTANKTFAISTANVMTALNMIRSMPSSVESQIRPAQTLSMDQFEQLQKDIDEYNALDGVVEIRLVVESRITYMDSKGRRPIAHVVFAFDAAEVDDGLNPEQLRRLLDMFEPYADQRYFTRDIHAELTKICGVDKWDDSDTDDTDEYRWYREAAKSRARRSSGRSKKRKSRVK